MCPAATSRKGKRFYDEELASEGNCDASAADFNLGQAVASIYGTSAGTNKNSDETGPYTGIDRQTSPSVGSFRIGDNDSISPKSGVNLNLPGAADSVGGLPPSLVNPTTPGVNLFQNLLKSGNAIKATPNNQMTYASRSL
ncbi:hypothetical protein MMC07_004003 [Pseudocyphellaria aurata]|nr:hypothetical protein [Pseudocyphellaria aurata]